MKLIKSIFLVYLCFISEFFAQTSVPQNLTAEYIKYDYSFAYDKVVKLTWQGGSLFSSFYNVYRFTGSSNNTNDFSYLGSARGISNYMDFTIEEGKTYSYYVTIVQNDVESGPSNIVEIKVGDTPIVSEEKATISGKVTDESNGEPLQDIYVSLISMTSSLIQTVTTNSDGNYNIEIIPGDYKLLFKPISNYYKEFYDNKQDGMEADVIKLAANDELKNINAALTPIPPVDNMEYFNVSGNVSDNEGNPIDAMIEIMKLGPSNYPTFKDKILTDSEGNYSIKVEKGFEIIVYAQPINNMYYGEYFDNANSIAEAKKIAVNDDIENVNFLLEAKPTGDGSISGVVKNSDNEMVDAIVIAIRLGAEKSSENCYTRATIINQGEYQLSHLVMGDYILFAMPEFGYIPTFYRKDGTSAFRWKDADVLKIQENTVLTNKNFIVHKMAIIPDNGFAEIKGSVIDNASNPILNAFVQIYNQNKELITFAFTDNDGNYSAKGLAPGLYSVACDDYSFLYKETQSVYADANAQTKVDFKLEADPVLGTNAMQIYSDYKLEQNYPNPFNPSTNISFTIVKKSYIELNVYNILGSKIRIITKGEYNPGNYNLTFNASDLPSGIYIYELKADNFRDSKKMLLLK